MKKRFLVIMILAGLILGVIYKYGSAFQTTVWLSSNSAVNISTSPLCNTTGSGGSVRSILHGVCINTAMTGNVQIFNSSVASASTTITGVYSTATQVPCNFYDVESSSNLFVNHNSSGDVTITYQCY